MSLFSIELKPFLSKVVAVVTSFYAFLIVLAALSSMGGGTTTFTLGGGVFPTASTFILLSSDLELAELGMAAG